MSLHLVEFANLHYLWSDFWSDFWNDFLGAIFGTILGLFFIAILILQPQNEASSWSLYSLNIVQIKFSKDWDCALVVKAESFPVSLPTTQLETRVFGRYATRPDVQQMPENVKHFSREKLLNKIRSYLKQYIVELVSKELNNFGGIAQFFRDWAPGTQTSGG